MLDSLVRVSRRVGRADDRFATDPEPTAEFDRASHRAVKRHCKQSPSVVRSTNATDRRPTAHGRPRPANESHHARPITPTPKRRSPCLAVFDRLRAGRGAPLRESALAAKERDPSAAPTTILRRFKFSRMPTDEAPTGRQAESAQQTLRSRPFASKRFHVLLNSLFKVLFNFPSRYLFAIGLVIVFSLRWSLPPALGCILKQPDSKIDPCETRPRR